MKAQVFLPGLGLFQTLGVILMAVAVFRMRSVRRRQRPALCSTARCCCVSF